MDPKSPPLPFTASTLTDLPVNGSGNSIFELVLPPPKFVMRRSAPSKLERYRNKDRGLPSNFVAVAGSHKSPTKSVFFGSGIHGLAIVFKSLCLSFPFVCIYRFKLLHGKRASHNFTNLFQ